MKKIFILFLIFISVSIFSLPQEIQNRIEFYEQQKPDYYGFVLRVADGDTFYIKWFTEINKAVRVKGIDTPETVHRNRGTEFWGFEASAYAKQVLKPGTLVRLVFEGTIIDPFGRLLAYVWYWNGEEWINYQKEMLMSGNAFVYHNYYFEYPNQYMDWQEYAMKRNLGMWSNLSKIQNDIVISKEDFANKKLWYRREFYGK
jgi:micrococcal nuclease